MNKTTLILLSVVLVLSIGVYSLLDNNFSLAKNPSNNVQFTYGDNYVEMELQNGLGKIINYNITYGTETIKEIIDSKNPSNIETTKEVSFSSKSPTSFDNKVIYAFDILGTVNTDYVKILISSNKELIQSGNLELRYLESQVNNPILDGWDNYGLYKWKVLDFTDLQTKNPLATITMKYDKGWYIEIKGATNFDPTISDVYTSSSTGVYNDTIYDSQKAGVRLETEALLIMDYDDATNDQTRVQDYSLWNQTVWNSTGQLGTYNTTDCISGNCWEFNGINSYQNITKYEGLTGEGSIWNFNDSFSVHYCSKIDTQSAGGPVVYRRSTYGWGVQSSFYSPDFFFDTPAGNSNCAGTVQMNDSLWHCYDFIYYGPNYQTSPNRTVYKDGVWSHSCATTATSIRDDGNIEAVIGAISVYSTWFNGTLDNIQIYNRSLTPEEVLYLNNTPQANLNYAYPSGNWTSPSYYGEANTSSWDYLHLACSVWNNSYTVYSDCAENITMQVLQSDDNVTWNEPEPLTYNGSDYIPGTNITKAYTQYIMYFNNVTEWLTPVVSGIELFWSQEEEPPLVDNGLWGLVLIVFILGVVSILLIIAWIIDVEHAILKTFLIMLAIIILIVGVHIIRTVVEISSDIGLADTERVTSMLDNIYLAITIILVFFLVYFFIMFMIKMVSYAQGGEK